MADVKKQGIENDTIVQQFIAITGADESTAMHFLEACEGDLSAAIGMHIDSNGAGASASAPLIAAEPKPGSSKSTVPSNANCSSKQTRNGSPVERKKRPRDEDDVRSPIPQKHEVLVQENFVFGREGRRRKAQSVFDQFRDFQAEAKHHEMSQNGAASGSKRKTLEDLFRPPIDLLHKGSFKSAREAASSSNKWLIANIQNVQEFACQVLNRDVWSNSAVKEVIRQHFILWQAYSDSEEGKRYMVLYKVNDWPYIAVIDPRTGEQLISWHKLEANSFCEIASEFLELHPVPDESQLSSPLSKKACKDRSIVDASEDSQLTAAIAASINEKSYKSMIRPAISDMWDDDNACLYSSDSDGLETFSDSDNSCPALPCSSKTNKMALTRTSPVDETVVSVAETEESRTCNDGAKGYIDEAKGCYQVGESVTDTANGSASQDLMKSLWRNYLGSESDPKSNIVLRFPNGMRQQLSVPCSSKLLSIIEFVAEHGFSPDLYELVTTFPKRKLSQLDPNTTLKDCGLNSQETIFVQEL